jgi:hypothetical protein
MTQFSQELIDEMKAMYAERGKTISDYEANEAMNRLCGFFDLLHKWDQEENAKQQTEKTESSISQ